MDLSFFDQILTPVIAIDKAGKPYYFNFICSTFFQLPPRKLQKCESFEDLILSSKLDIQKYIEEVEDKKTYSLTPETKFQTPGGDIYNCVFKFFPLGEYIIINILDFSIEKRLHEKYKEQIIELRETHEQILKADKLTALGEIIAGIGHEISTPLMIMNNRLENLENYLGIGDFTSSQVAVESLRKEYNRVVKIFSGMKSIVKNQEDLFEIVDLNQVAQETIEFFNGLDSCKGIELKKTVDDENLWVMANKIKLEQVVINLIKNAIDSLRDSNTPQPKITISLTSKKELQLNQVDVIDNGPGVASEHKSKIFDMFYTSKDIGAGTGLGLAISKKIIESFSGNIDLVETKTGCQFSIEIPTVELGSFTLTNKYLSGTEDREGPKILFYGKDIDHLNEIYASLASTHHVLIFSADESRLSETLNFLLVDCIVLIDKCNHNGLDDFEILDISEKDDETQLKILEHKFGS
ncbi:MAG: hypothetical protein CME62_00645 [Halobacteriovoraceae bacterium]|nr:hypothetical protein [Halobacteriovoraceae bacterium]|tara:strand:- start:31562 stop:32959 length:1398 start_codon:yes stop_codon:yes gene_type:complete